MRETYRCVYDNVQLYVGSDMLSWLCTEEADWMKWRKLHSSQFGIYFEGLSNLDKYGFKLEWRMPPELTSTTTTTTTSTTTTSPIKALIARPVWASRMEKPSKAEKA